MPGWRAAEALPPTQEFTLNAQRGGPYGIAWTLNGDAAAVPFVATYSNRNAYVDVAAAGSRVLSTSGGVYTLMSGTSMSAPHVAAVAALIAEKCGHFVRTPAQVLADITSSAGPVYGFLPGVGLLKADAALAATGC